MSWLPVDDGYFFLQTQPMSLSTDSLHYASAL